MTDNDNEAMYLPAHRDRKPGPLIAWLMVLAVVLAAAALSPGVAANYFFSDSYAYIALNDALRAFPLYEFWRVSETPLFWRELLPLRDLVYRVEMAVFGLEPIPYKAVNLLLLVLGGLVTWLFSNDFFRRFGSGRTDMPAAQLAATIALALWIAHPSHVESVAWAAGLKDVLSGLLGIASLYAFQKALPMPGEPPHLRLRPLVASCLLFAAALMSKITVAPVAGMAALLAGAALSHPRPSWRSLAKAALAALPLLLIAVATVVAQILFAEASQRIELFAAINDARFERAVRILGAMYQMAVIPFDSRFTWDIYQGSALGALRLALAVLAIIGAVWGVWAFVARRVPEGFGLAVAFGATIPVLHLIPFETWSLASERHLSWTVFGLALVAGSLAARAISRSARSPAPISLALAAIVLVFLGLSFQRSLEWLAGPEHLRLVENEAAPSSGFGAVMRIEDELRFERYDIAMKIATRVEDEAQRHMLEALVRAVQAIMDLSRDRQSPAAFMRADRAMLQAEEAVRAVGETVSDPASIWLFYTMQRRLVPPFEGLIQLAPRYGMFSYRLALIKKDGLREHEQQEAERLFLQAIGTGSLPPAVQAEAWSEIALTRMRRDNTGGARQALMQAMAADPAQHRAAWLLAELETRLGNFEAASSAAQQYRTRAAAAGIDAGEIEARLNELAGAPK